MSDQTQPTNEGSMIVVNGEIVKRSVKVGATFTDSRNQPGHPIEATVSDPKTTDTPKSETTEWPIDPETGELMGGEGDFATFPPRSTGNTVDRVLAERYRCAQIVRAKKPPRGSLSWWICDELEMIAQEIERG